MTRKREVNEGHVAILRKELFVEINTHKVNIDYSVFKKSPEDRILLAKLKKAWVKGPYYATTNIRSK